LQLTLLAGTQFEFERRVSLKADLQVYAIALVSAALT
jgi:hypothetical protein